MDVTNARRGGGGGDGGGRRRWVGDFVCRRLRKWVFHDENCGGKSMVAIEKLSDKLGGGDEMTHSRRWHENQLRRRLHFF